MKKDRSFSEPLSEGKIMNLLSRKMEFLLSRTAGLILVAFGLFSFCLIAIGKPMLPCIGFGITFLLFALFHFLLPTIFEVRRQMRMSGAKYKPREGGAGGTTRTTLGPPSKPQGPPTSPHGAPVPRPSSPPARKPGIQKEEPVGTGTQSKKV